MYTSQLLATRIWMASLQKFHLFWDIFVLLVWRKSLHFSRHWRRYDILLDQRRIFKLGIRKYSNRTQRLQCIIKFSTLIGTTWEIIRYPQYCEKNRYCLTNASSYRKHWYNDLRKWCMADMKRAKGYKCEWGKSLLAHYLISTPHPPNMTVHWDHL